MKKLPLNKAIGHVLAHDITQITADGKAARFLRGHVLEANDIPTLLDMGKHHIYVGAPPSGQVHEEDAGRIAAEILAGEHIEISAPAEGRFALTASTKGVLSIHSQGLIALNCVADFTAATLPNFMSVTSGQTVAGVRIIPLFTDEHNVTELASIEKTYGKLLHVHPFSPKKVGIVITGTEIYSGRVKDRFEAVLRKKLSAFDAIILDVIKCPDDCNAIQFAAKNLLQAGADIIFFTGGMSVDPDDITPSTIRALGSEVITHGVPIQPGNMLLLAKLEQVTLLGLPGSVMHHEATAFDFILPRIFADISITQSDIQKMGEGGLLSYLGKGVHPC